MFKVINIWITTELKIINVGLIKISIIFHNFYWKQLFHFQEHRDRSGGCNGASGKIQP